jgi:hypothetical protein
MKSVLTTTALATVLVFGLAAGPGMVRAQDANGQQCTGDNCPNKKMKGTEQNQQMNEQGTSNKKRMGTQQNGNESAQTDQGTQYKKKKMGNTQQNGDQMGTQENGNVKTQAGEETVLRKKRHVGVQENDVNVQVNAGTGREWRFDPSHERRSRSRSATFRFYFEGYYYPEPYWTHVRMGYGPGISCGEGRAIVAQRFNRVRVIECRGPIYTYFGRRSGDSFRVMVNARNGRIVGRDLM